MINTDGTIVDLQVTNLFLSMRRQDADLKLRSLMSPSIDTPHKDIRLPNKSYISSKKSVVTTEMATFLSLIQGVGNLTTTS